MVTQKFGVALPLSVPLVAIEPEHNEPGCRTQ